MSWALPEASWWIGDQAGHAAALEIFAAHRMAGTLWGDHQHVDVLARFDQGEMNIEAMGEQQRRSRTRIFSAISFL